MAITDRISAEFRPIRMSCGVSVGGTRTYFTSAAEVPFGLPGRRETANVKRNSEGAEGDGGNG